MRESSSLLTSTLCFGVCFGLSCLSISSAVGADPRSDDDKTIDTKDKIDTFVKALVECGNIPALNLAVVRNGQVIISKGYGYTRADKSQNTTSKTKFAIGSLTKAFTSLLVAKTVQDSPLITFDTPISEFLKDFWVSDDYESKHLTLRDMLGHRSMFRDDLLPYYIGFDRNVTREEFAKKLQYMTEPDSFREQFTYANGNYILVTEILERLNGKSWEAQVKEDIFKPLGMNDSGFITQISDWDSFARPCYVRNGELIDLSQDTLTANHVAGGAGAIYSTAEDMAKWMRFLLSASKSSSGIDLAMKRATFEPSISASYGPDLTRPESSISDTCDSYCMGWFRGLYREYKKMFHSGAIATYQSFIRLHPDVEAGVFLSVNGPYESSAPLGSISQYVSDLVLGLDPVPDSKSICDNIPNRPGVKKTTPASCKPNPSLDLTPYVGVYTRMDIGNVPITLNASSNRLHFNYGYYGGLELCPVRKSKGVFKGIYTGAVSYLNYFPGTIIQFEFSRNKENLWIKNFETMFERIG